MGFFDDLLIGVTTGFLTKPAIEAFDGDDSGEAERDATEKALQEDKEIVKGLEELYGKSFDELSRQIDIEAEKQKGIINQGQADLLEEYNRFDEDQKKLVSQRLSELKAREQNILQTIAETSLLNEEAIEETFGKTKADIERSARETGQSISDFLGRGREDVITGVSDAIDALNRTENKITKTISDSGVFDASARALRVQQAITGTLSPEERQKFEKDFGPFEASPFMKFKLQQEQQRQQALGITASDEGLVRFPQIIEEETQQRFERAGELVERGEEARGKLAEAQLGLGQEEARLLGRRGETLADIEARGLTEAETARRARDVSLLAARQDREKQLLGTREFRSEQERLARTDIGRDIEKVRERQAISQQNLALQRANAIKQRANALLDIENRFGMLRTAMPLEETKQIAGLRERMSKRQISTRLGQEQVEASRPKDTGFMDLLGQLGGGALGFALGGPAGAAAGSQLGKSITEG